MRVSTVYIRHVRAQLGSSYSCLLVCVKRGHFVVCCVLPALFMWVLGLADYVQRLCLHCIARCMYTPQSPCSCAKCRLCWGIGCS